jgi:hypothetical protein
MERWRRRLLSITATAAAKTLVMVTPWREATPRKIL